MQPSPDSGPVVCLNTHHMSVLVYSAKSFYFILIDFTSDVRINHLSVNSFTSVIVNKLLFKHAHPAWSTVEQHFSTSLWPRVSDDDLYLRAAFGSAAVPGEMVF